MKKSKPDYFWISYSDLMTSLFFVMLVLFVISKLQWDDKEKKLEAATLELKAANEELTKQRDMVNEINRAIESLPREFFTYKEKFKRYEMNRKVEFFQDKDILKNPNDELYIVNIGRSIQKVISDLQAKNYKNVRYVVIIEGMSSKEGEVDRNYELSYRRALRVKRIWDSHRIFFDESIVEVQIAGSGTAGIGREVKDIENRRILIHIVPKIGRMEIIK